MVDDGSLERATFDLLRLAWPLTRELDLESAVTVVMAAASLMVIHRTGCDFEASYRRLRRFADRLAEEDRLN